MSEELVNEEELQVEEEIQEDVLSEDEALQEKAKVKEGELPPALQKAIDKKKGKNDDDDEDDDGDDDEDEEDEEEAESAKASTKKESIQVPKTKSAMVKDIYEKINSLKKADLEGLYSSYMTVEEGKDEDLSSKDVEDMGGDPEGGSPPEGIKPLKPKKKKIKAPKAESVQIDVKQDVEALVQGEELSDEFKSKAATIFEAAVHAKVVNELNKRIEDLEKEYQEEAEIQTEEFRKSMTEKVDGYLNYVVEEWMGENELAVEKGIRSELVEDFMSGLKNLFQEHYIDIPEEKVDLVDDLFSKVEELENKLNEQTTKNIDLTKSISEYKKEETVDTVCEDLTDTQSEKVKELAKGVEYEDESQYKGKLEMIVENYFPTAQVKSEEEVTNDDNSDEENTEKLNAPLMEEYTKAITRSNK